MNNCGLESVCPQWAAVEFSVTVKD